MPKVLIALVSSCADGTAGTEQGRTKEINELNAGTTELRIHD